LIPSPTTRALYAVDVGVFVGERGVALEWDWTNKVVPSAQQPMGAQYPSMYVERNPAWFVQDSAPWVDFGTTQFLDSATDVTIPAPNLYCVSNRGQTVFFGTEVRPGRALSSSHGTFVQRFVF
jgi:hypothetical protein